jgi:hypothetical protein
MTEKTTIPFPLFEFFFKPHVRVLLNWKLLAENQSSVIMFATRDLDLISQWYAPWHINSSRQEANYDDVDARPIRLNELRNLLPVFNKERQEKIKRLSEELRAFSPPVQVMVPTYSLRDNSQFILDNNHRLSALILEKIPFRLMVFSIQGLLDRSFLPDLRQWEHK